MEMEKIMLQDTYNGDLKKSKPKVQWRYYHEGRNHINK